MMLERIANRIDKRAHKRRYRRMVKRWYDDGGDYRFRFDYPLDTASMVLDLGGYQGLWASDLYSRYRCRILVFEPVASFANEIRERFRHNDDIEVCQFGLGARSRTETIHVCGASSSLYKKKARTEQVRIVDVKEWFDVNGTGSVQLMKVNIEGGEFELLERLIDTGLIAAIEHIQVQFHYIGPDSERQMEAIQAGMAKTHLPTYQYKFVWENWTRKTESAK
jgi:FkbM family methyltransferase